MIIYVKLFFAFFQVGLFSFGGGYAALPLIQNQVVNTYGWLNMSEFTDIITISQMTPGPIAINSATFVGTRIAGIGGAIIATVGCILPSVVIVLILAMLYKKYSNIKYVNGVMKSLKPAVVGLIASAGVVIVGHALFSGGGVDLVAVLLMGLCMFALRKFNTNPILVMLSAGAIGGLIYSFI